MTFKIAWHNYEKKLPKPKRVRKIKQINFEEFKNKVLEEAEKNRNDKNHREQLMKYCLIMFAGFILFGLIQWL